MKKIKALSLGLALSLCTEMNVWGSDDATPFPEDQYTQALAAMDFWDDAPSLREFFGDSVSNIIITNPKYFNLSLKFAQNSTPDEYLGALNDLSRVRYADLDDATRVASKIENIIDNPDEKKRLLYKFLKTVAANRQSKGLLSAIQGSVDPSPPEEQSGKLKQLIDDGFFDLSAIGDEDGFAAAGHGYSGGSGYAAAGQVYGGGGYAAAAPYTGMAGDDIDSVDISDVRDLLEIFGAVGDPEIEGNLKLLRSNGVDLQSDVFDNVTDASALRETVSTLAAAILERSY